MQYKDELKLDSKDSNQQMRWGDETKLKFMIANNIASGKNTQKSGRPKCKIVVVLLGDNDECLSDIEYVKFFHAFKYIINKNNRQMT